MGAVLKRTVDSAVAHGKDIGNEDVTELKSELKKIPTKLFRGHTS